MMREYPRPSRIAPLTLAPLTILWNGKVSHGNAEFRIKNITGMAGQGLRPVCGRLAMKLSCRSALAGLARGERSIVLILRMLTCILLHMISVAK